MVGNSHGNLLRDATCFACSQDYWSLPGIAAGLTVIGVRIECLAKRLFKAKVPKTEKRPSGKANAFGFFARDR